MGGTSAPGPLAPLSSHPPCPGARPLRAPSGVPAARDQPAAAVGNLPPPAPEFWIPGSPSPMPSARLYLFPDSGAEYSSKPARRGSGLGQGQFARAGAEAPPLPSAGLGIGRRTGEATGPGSVSSPCAPHSAKFIQGAARACVGGCGGERIGPRNRSGAKALLGGVCFVPNLPNLREGGQSQSFASSPKR